MRRARGAQLDAGVPVIELPDTRIARGDDPGVDALLSDALGQTVTLAREDRVSHFDAAPLHLLTTVSLAWLRAALPGSRVGARRFRPNLVIDVPGEEPVEQGWIGAALAIGDAVRLRVVAPTERCAMVAFAQDELPFDAAVLREIAQRADVRFGVYAQVETPGVVRRGDRVAFAPGGAPIVR